VARLSDRSTTRPGYCRRVLRTARDTVLMVLDRIALLTPRRAPRHGIAVMTPHGLGDLVLFTEAFRHLRAFYPGQPVLLICSSRGRGYAEACLRPERILVVDRDRMRRDPWYRLRIVIAIARAGVRIAIQPGYNRVHLVEDALVRASRAEERIGTAGSPMFISARARARGDRWYTRLIEEPSGLAHDAERNAAFVAGVTGSTPPRVMPRLAKPRRHPEAPAGGYIAVAPGASSAMKAWPADNFIAAARAVAAPTDLSVVLVGETRPSRPMAGSAAVDLRGRTDVNQLISILAYARIVLCNDSAPAHLAAALGVPVVAVGGGGMPERYLPYPAARTTTGQPRLVVVDPPWPCFGCGWQCRFAPARGDAAPCVAAITVRQVVDAAVALLGTALVESS
jgi:ADP-heptose:LPS heptosyltransferase